MLVLPIKKKWFNMILSGLKREEYREIKPYWFTRFNHYMFHCINEENLIIRYAKGIVIFKKGYQKKSPKIMCRVEITTDFGRAEWGAEPNKLYYVLKILSVEIYSKDITVGSINAMNIIATDNLVNYLESHGELK